MAFDKAGFQNVGVGPVKLFIYSTADTLETESFRSKATGLCSDNCPGLAVGDVVICAHAASSVSLIRISGLAATTCTYTDQQTFMDT